MRALDAHDRALLRLLEQQGPQPCVTQEDYEALAKRLQQSRGIVIGAVCSVVAHRCAVVREGRLELVEPKPKRLHGASPTMRE